MKDITIPIAEIAENPKVSEVIMNVSEHEGIPVGEATLLTLRIFAHDAALSAPKPDATPTPKKSA